MSHGPWDDRLGPYFDGELSAEEAALVRQHLPGCASCRERLEELTRLSSSIRSVPRETMPDDLKRVILARTGAITRARLVTPFRLTTLAAAAVAVIVAATVWRTSPPPLLDRSLAERPVAEKSTVDGRNDRSVSSPTDATDRLKSIGDIGAAGSAGGRDPAGAAGGPASAKPPSSRADRLELNLSKQARAGAVPKDEPVKDLAMGEQKEGESTVQSVQEPAASQSQAAPPAPPPAEPRTDGDRVIARYTATLVLEAGRPARLTTIVPLMAPQVASEESRQKARQRPAPTANSLAAGSARTENVGSVVTFLVQVDAGGKILTADPIGARTQDSTVVDSARALLVGSALTPFETGRAMSVVVEVTVPRSPSE